LRKPQHQPLPARRNKFQGCRYRHQQAFPQPILMITEGSCIPCTRSHNFQGSLPMSLQASPPARLPSYSPMSLPASLPAHQPSPSNLPADLSKCQHLWKWQAPLLCNAATPTSTTPHIRTWAQVATAAAWVAPPSLSTCSRTRQSGVPLPSHWPGFAAASMRQQRHQRNLVCVTHPITRLKNQGHQAMAVMDKDMGKLHNYRQLVSSPKYGAFHQPTYLGNWQTASEVE
jgi:hypothetical protein